MKSVELDLYIHEFDLSSFALCKIYSRIDKRNYEHEMTIKTLVFYVFFKKCFEQKVFLMLFQA